jgi:hypothetical protein
MKSLANYIRKICQRIYISGIHLYIDKIMLAYKERSKHTIKLKNKSIKEGYKNWILLEATKVYSAKMREAILRICDLANFLRIA